MKIRLFFRDALFVIWATFTYVDLFLELPSVISFSTDTNVNGHQSRNYKRLVDVGEIPMPEHTE